MPKPPSRLGSIGCRGTRHPLCKLDPVKVQYIRRTDEGVVSLAHRFKVTHGTISKARARISWAWLDAEENGA
jgi:hypothetical protein